MESSRTSAGSLVYRAEWHIGACAMSGTATCESKNKSVLLLAISRSTERNVWQFANTLRANCIVPGGPRQGHPDIWVKMRNTAHPRRDLQRASSLAAARECVGLRLIRSLAPKRQIGRFKDKQIPFARCVSWYLPPTAVEADLTSRQ